MVNFMRWPTLKKVKMLTVAIPKELCSSLWRFTSNMEINVDSMCLLSHPVDFSFPLNYRRLMYDDVWVSNSKAAKVCKSVSYKTISTLQFTKKTGAEPKCEKCVKNTWKHRESVWKTRDFRVPLIREKHLFLCQSQHIGSLQSSIYTTVFQWG